MGIMRFDSVEAWKEHVKQKASHQFGMIVQRDGKMEDVRAAPTPRELAAGFLHAVRAKEVSPETIRTFAFENALGGHPDLEEEVLRVSRELERIPEDDAWS